VRSFRVGVEVRVELLARGVVVVEGGGDALGMVG